MVFSPQEKNDIFTNAENAEDAFIRLHTIANERDGHARAAYLCMSDMKEHFGQQETINAIMIIAPFDEVADHKFTVKAAQNAQKKVQLWLGHDRIKADVEKYRIGAFRDDNLLYVVHPCVKPGENKWQCTTFGKNQTQPLGDTARKTIDALLANDASGAGPTLGMRAVPFEEIDELMRGEFAIISQAMCLARGVEREITASGYSDSLTAEQIASKIADYLSNATGHSVSRTDVLNHVLGNNPKAKELEKLCDFALSSPQTQTVDNAPVEKTEMNIAPSRLRI